MRNYQYNNLTIGQYSNRKGTTLIELVMVIVIVGILAGASSMYIKETIDLWRFLNFRNEVVSQGRMALFRMEREIRQVKDPYSIALADSGDLRFTAIDLDEDENDDTVEFFRNASDELRRIFNGSPAQGYILVSPVTNPVGNPIFTYYDSNNSQLATPVGDRSTIRRIGVELWIQAGSQTKILKSQIYLRNL